MATARRDATATLSELMDKAPVAAFAKDGAGRYIYANPYFLATMGSHMGSDWQGKTDTDLWPPIAAAVVRARDEAILKGGGTQVFSYQMESSDLPHNVLFIEFALQAGATELGIGGLAVDLTASSVAENEYDRLVSAVQNTADAIVMLDPEGRIRDVNRAFERISGYSRDEVIGRTREFLRSGIHPAAFYEDMQATMAAGRDWSGELVNRRKDGSFLTSNTVILPVRSAVGAIVGYVSIISDRTEEILVAARAASSTAGRKLVLDAISGLLPDSTLEEKAQAICRNVAGLTGIAAAQILVFESDLQALPIGHVVAGREDPPLRRLSFQISRRLHARAVSTAWIEPWENRQGRAYNQLLEHAGPSALACAPVFSGKRLVGLITVQSIDVTNKGVLDELLPVIVDFAAVTGGALGSEMAEWIDAQTEGDHVASIIRLEAFTPVFQPIVDMALDNVVGYEALTRFTDGSDPEALFAEAKAVRLGIELEIATLSAALDASKALPPHVWLNVNASPDLILAGKRLRTLLAGIHRPLVVEVTEHTAIVDFPKFRAAMASLGPQTRLAVDDAGAGFAGLRHILELHPEFVKLDRWLVAGLETDEARQAMIAGLQHFARKTGCRLIAEGIETDREIAVLRSLDVTLGQGYALGRPRAWVPSPAPVAVGHR